MALEPNPAKSSSVTRASKVWNVVRPIATIGPTNVETVVASPRTEEDEVLHASLKAASVAQIVVAAIAVIGLI
jgi:hypothetical protein